MVNPIFQQDEELLLNPFGSKYLPSGTYTDVNSNQFVVQEDAVISVLTGGDASIAENNIDYKASMSLSGVTLKKGALIVAPVRESFKSITIDSGAIMAYNCVVKGQKTGSLLEFSPYNIWDSEHITIDGTTTTLHDFNTFGDKIDMSNPSASNQPTYNAASANFNGLPSFTFDGVSQYVKGDIVDYRDTDTSGVIVNVFRHLSGALLIDFNYSLSSSATRYLITYINTNSYRPAILPSILRSFRGGTNIVTGSPSSVVAYADTGASYSMNINGNSETITMISGTNDGEAWFDGNPFDTISIGGIVLSSGVLFGNLEWCMSGYFPYTDESTTLEIVNFLKNKYGVA